MFPSHTKFLVVDDSQVMREILVMALKKLGYTNITHASDGREALSLMKSAVFMDKPFDLVLADIWMLDMDGRNLLKESRMDPELAKALFFFVTAERNKNYLAELISDGAAGYAFKPVNEETLKAKLTEIYVRKNQPQGKVSFEILEEPSKASEMPPPVKLDPEKLYPILNLIPGFILRVTPENEVQEINHNLRALYNLSPEQIISQKLVQSLFSSASPMVHLELKLELAGETHHFSLICQKYNDNSEAIVIGTSTTSQKKAQEQLEILSNKIASAEEMAAAIAYQANIPLLVIQTRVTRLLQLAQSGKAKADAMIDDIKKVEDGAGRIKKIIKNLRSLARREQKEPAKHILLKDLLSEVIEPFQTKAIDQQIDFNVGEIPEQLALECRESEISLVLLNLLNNAFEAADKLTEKWVRIETFERNNAIEIAVTDSGAGISRELSEKISRPFYNPKSSEVGSGLGLAISKGIVEDHNGTLRIDPNYPNTRIIITLPSLN